jgi:hypothetical protein
MPLFGSAVRCPPELYRLLQPRGRQAGPPAIHGIGQGTARATGLGNRAAIGSGRRPARHLLSSWRNLPRMKGMTVMINSIYNGYRYEEPLARQLSLSSGADCPVSRGELISCLAGTRARAANIPKDWTWAVQWSRILGFRAGVPGWVRGTVGKSGEALAMMDELDSSTTENRG